MKGLVVNKKVNIRNNYYKLTRARADSYYRKQEFMINNSLGTVEQLEEIFSFIHKIDEYNNQLDDEKHLVYKLNGREKSFSKIFVL